MRQKSVFHIKNPDLFKKKLLYWCSHHPVFCFFDRNKFNRVKSYNISFDIIAATASDNVLICDSGNAFGKLNRLLNHENDWFFGIFGYDLKNENESLNSKNFDGIGFSDMQFFKPGFVFIILKNKFEIHYPKTYSEDEILHVYEEIEKMDTNSIKFDYPAVQHRISEPEYIKKVKGLKDHIHRGDIFEVNLCQEFFVENIQTDPVDLFLRLIKFSPSPFSCIFRFYDKYLISSSPERYLKKTGHEIISQPMKGTIKRGLNIEDKRLKYKLRNDPKERSENIMIVDLVRNDLSKTAVPNTVFVDELCKIYSYKTVHQMVSTIKSKLDPAFSAVDVIKSSFPMGSMTGAPKVKAMQLIEEFEETKRGAFSGSAGFFTPEHNFDFNVLIRSILYNSLNKYLSFSAGSAITSQSVPENEYEECLLKAFALKKVLSNS